MARDPQKPGTDRPGDHSLFIVIRRTGGGECKIVPDGDPYPATYTKIYGPSSYGKCEACVAENCRETGPPL